MNLELISKDTEGQNGIINENVTNIGKTQKQEKKEENLPKNEEISR